MVITKLILIFFSLPTFLYGLFADCTRQDFYLMIYVGSMLPTTSPDGHCLSLVLINRSRCVLLCFLLCLCFPLIQLGSLHIQLVDLSAYHANRNAMPYKVMRKQALDALYNAN